MKHPFFKTYSVDYIEIYTPMAKVLAYWHTQALGFNLVAVADHETGKQNMTSYVLKSGAICLVLTTAYPTTSQSDTNSEINSFISKHYCGVKRFALRTSSVKEAFEKSIANGAIPIKFPSADKDESGYIEEASIKLYDSSEIVFTNRDFYKGVFKPGYKAREVSKHKDTSVLLSIDHIASEVRINEINYWTNYLTNAIGTNLVQSIKRSDENKTGMILNINQSEDKNLTLVMAEPDTYSGKSKVQQNIDKFGPGIHHIAFSTNDLISTTQQLMEKDVEFVKFPSSYYDLLRNNNELKGFDIDTLQKNGILIDKEEDTYLLQKFIKPISDRPFFLYEIVQRVNGYNGFALKNINVLKKAEEMEIMKVGSN
ncbi:MAG TPA: VOC family protein [Bacteroidia bacterium]|nr:VOC family protein [Bacteroidia bacterium]